MAIQPARVPAPARVSVAGHHARSLILRAHAKINLHLDIGPRRRDGYHSLKTIFQEISLHDTLRFSKGGDSIELTVVSAQGRLSAGPDNLVVRALELLRAKLKIKKGLRVHLTKRIPMGAGLGGGSSDAAAALWGGWLMWKKNGSSKKPSRVPPVLFDCARRLGADVPFFLKGGIATAEGIGEKLKPLKPHPKRWMVLIYPKVHVSTPLAYRLLDESRRGRPHSPFAILHSAFDISHSTSFNSFEPVILKKFPAIAKAKQALVDLGCDGAMMSGSGSSVFGFVKNAAQGRKVIKQLIKWDWDSHLIQTI